MLIGTDSTESEIVYLRSRIAIWSDASASCCTD